jgi:predicted molibdopterin-dependent oxidoreductase YjgC
MAKRIDRWVRRPDAVEITVDGRPVSAYPGESLAAALAAAGILGLRSSPRAGAARGMFCLMGVCQECAVEVDGRLVTSCTEPVAGGMAVRLGSRP